MGSVPLGGGMDVKAGRANSTYPVPAPQGTVPATPPAGELDEWETKVVDELKSLKSLWENYKREYLSPAISQLREMGTKGAIDEAVELERYNEMVRSLFIEVERELDVEIRARQRGDEVNMVIAAQRVSEALDVLKVYAKEWKSFLDELLREVKTDG
jgi:hypothetical protein